MHELNMIQQLAAAAIPLLFAITVHEVAHGWAARQLGDPTAMMLGRLTLNPLRHVDPVGTVLVPVASLLLGGFIFGWAKPVPVTWENLRHPKRDMALVALAGPGANLLMVFGWAVMMKIGLLLTNDLPFLGRPLVYMADFGITANIALMVLNLLPIPPLDGGRVISSVLPDRLSYRFNLIEPYGLFVLLALLVSGVLWNIIYPPIVLMRSFIFTLLGL